MKSSKLFSFVVFLIHVSMYLSYLPSLCYLCSLTFWCLSSWNPIWSSGQDSWFSPRRPGFHSRYGNQQYFLHQVMDTFHLTQISGNSGSKSNGTEIFRKFVSKISAGSPLEVVHFSGNLEIPEISSSILHFYPVWIGPSSFSGEKLQDGDESFESTLHWMQNDLP